ncbi:LysR family transcriptional regulator [Neobacillus niacini]|uniref:LysR family transcriptional regulator n=1 Tax=Neobacillus niacini TaxID=86668 RepID=UPI00300124F6
MNIENLKVFCLVVEEGSISQAARLRFLSQPAATKQIHQLENFYDTLLFDREGGKLKITEIGKKLYPFARTIVNDFNRSKEMVQQVKGELNSILAVGASFSIGEFLLPNLLGTFKKQYSDSKVMLTIKNTPSILEDLSNDLIDLALVEGMVENKEFIVEKLKDDQLILICPSNHQWNDQIDITDLENERMIWRESTSGTRLIIENMLKEHNVLEKIESYMELGSMQAIKSAVEAGLGISILPKIVVARELEQGYLRKVDIKGVNLTRHLWLVKKHSRFPNTALTNFIQLIKGT